MHWRSLLAAASWLRLWILVPALGAAGCASPYFSDRGRDAADIFTLTVSEGVGVRLRAGPIHAGAVAGVGTTGLRGGAYRSDMGNDAGELEFLIFPVVKKIMDLQPYWCFSAELFEPDDPRGKGYRAFSHVPLITTVIYPDEGQPARQFHPYLTQVEAQLGLIVCFRVGFNPGELLDFVLGWTCLDIFQDDISAKQSKAEAVEPRKSEK